MNIIVQPTKASEWYELIHETLQLTGHSFDESVQSYLVLTLDTFTQNHPVPDTPIAIDFLQATRYASEKSNNKLREIGDHCLILCGLFPEHATKKNLSNTYFVDIGQQAYLTLADRANLKLDPELFYQLGLNFLDIKEVLNAIRGIHSGRCLQ